ncbi:PKD domain-containing protein [Chryseolinea soli]|uniref:Tandem-95 repeat protein n=1 Tax=Chryseolinea soli TaxID=2321403 RepID=A0A385SQP1_9BACT|nr:tandem-95 repeat protein [Chryseolinea soli]AYB33172.1 tandem-95 repeat protein [Chryseolinea soli]
MACRLSTLAVLTALFTSFYTQLNAQCGCNFIISTSAAEWQFDGVKKGVKPGDKICFASGTRTGIGLLNIHGTVDKPVIITNMCDGKVTINAPASYGNSVQVDNCTFIHMTGSANPNEKYGIEIRGGQMGINFQSLSSDLEVDHLQVNFTGCCGIVAKTDPTCDKSTWRGNFVMKNLIFHDNYIGDTGCEGFYIGNSHYDSGVDRGCGQTVYEHDIEGCLVYNNELRNIGNDGIQIGSVTKGCEVHHNTVYNVATKANYGHQNGFQAGGGTTRAVVHDNIIDTGTGHCYYDSGGGGIYYNNLGINGLQGGFLLQDTNPGYAPTGFIVSNNTLINCQLVGLLMFSENPAQSQFVNNIIVATNQANGYAYINLNNPKAIKLTETNNIKTNDINLPKFVDAAGKNFHLLAGSSAIDGGKDMSAFGINDDFDGAIRPSGGKYDIGAFEYQTGKVSANAGKDVIITLPTNTVTLPGTGVSLTGITGYLWTKKSGGAATLVNDNTATVTVNGLVAGSYVFQLQVTDAGGTAFDEVTVTVNPAAVNQNPTAKAGVDQVVTLPTNTLTLKGQGTDPEGGALTYAWTKLSGPAVTLAGAATTDLLLTVLLEGVYQFQLTVTDDKGASATDVVQVTVNPVATNKPPVTNAGVDKTIYLPINQVTLTATASDPEGGALTILWEKKSGSTATLTNDKTLSLTASNLLLGTYVFRVTVTDNKGATAFDEVTVSVLQSNQSPTANAGADKSITLPTSTVVITGSGTDSDGSIASYAWVKVSGGAATLANANTNILTVTGMVAGTYKFGLTVTDNNGATGYDEVNVVVNAAPVNTPPVVSAGPDKNLTLPNNTVVLTGTATDADGIASVAWTKKSGPAATMVNQATLSLTLQNLVAGVYVFSLEATDTKGAKNSADVVVAVQPNTVNQSPVASAGANKFITLPTNSTTLTGTSSDPDGSIASVLWTKASGPAATLAGDNTATLTLTNLVEGIYVFRFTVTDNQGASASDLATVTVTTGNIAPVVYAGGDKTVSAAVGSYDITATANDPDGTVDAYTWIKVSGPAATLSGQGSPTLSVNGLNVGDYVFQISVLDNNLASASDQMTLTVLPASTNQLPTVVAESDQIIYLPTNSIVLNVTANDPDGTIASYAWTQTGGPAALLNNETTDALTVLNMVAGTYKFKIVAQDNDGGSGTDEVQVTVQPATTNQPPIANAGGNKILQLPTNSITLAGSGTDGDGSIASYAWTKVSGPAATLVTPAIASLQVNNLVEGTYVFRLMVTDDKGATGSSTATITVLPATVNRAPFADAGPNQSLYLPATSTTLSGSGFDEDGTIQSYAWTQVSGPNTSVFGTPAAANTTLAGLVTGTYRLRLTVTDDSNATGSDDILITVSDGTANKPPLAIVQDNQTITLPTNSINLVGSGFDPDGIIASYKWIKVSGGTATLTNDNTTTLTVTNLQEGQYAFQLTVTDNGGATNADITIVLVRPANVNQPPIAFAGGDKRLYLPVNATSLLGSGSDVDGTVISYDWTQTGGPAATLAGQDGATLRVSNLAQGTFSFRITVTDDMLASSFDQMTLLVVPPTNNLAPDVKLGLDTIIYLPQNTVLLNADVTDDGSIQSYLWTKASGPTVTLANPTEKDLNCLNLVEGVYTLQLTATDNGGASSFDQIVVTVLPATVNKPPVVNAGADQQIFLPTTQVTLNGTATDPDGTIASVKWKQVSGAAATLSGDLTLSLQVSNLAVGTYVFSLEATDNGGAVATDNVQVVVGPVPPNQPPVVSAGAGQVVNLPTTQATLNGTATDTDGTVQSVKWTQVQGPNTATISGATTLTLDVSGLVLGMYVFRLTATDDENASAYSDAIVYVTEDSQNVKKKPVAYAGDDLVIVLPDNEALIAGQGLDPDGFIERYFWEQIGGTQVPFTVDANVIHITDMALGDYVFRLTVVDSDTLSASDEVNISVIDKTDEIPKFFSPNNDNVGEYWTFRNVESYRECRLAVFARSGQQVFDAFPYENNWNGTYKGKPLGEGDYYYTLSCTDGRKLTGAVRILK